MTDKARVLEIQPNAFVVHHMLTGWRVYVRQPGGAVRPLGRRAQLSKRATDTSDDAWARALQKLEIE